MTKRLLVALLAIAAPLAAQAQQAKPIDPANRDTTCAPCRDFFQYANGGWLKHARIPADQASWGSFYELYERNLSDLRALLDEAGPQPGSDPGAKKLGTFYASCMDTTAVEKAGARPLASDLAAIAAIRSRAEVQAEIGRLHLTGVGTAFRFTAAQDDRNSDRVITIASQGGLGLPDRDYYTKTDSTSEALRRRYVAHVATMLRMVGDDSTAAAKSAESILALETGLARASMTRAERRNPDSTYHLMPLADLQRLTPHIGWPQYFASLGVPGVREVNVRQPRFYQALDAALANAPVDTWQAYLRWHLVRDAAPVLSSAFKKASFDFYSTTLRGVGEMQPRWKDCVEATDNLIGELLGQAYVKRHFTPDAKRRALEMVRNIQAEFHSHIEQLPWMSPTTKQRAFAKLDAIVNKIGYPDRWRDYSALTVRPAEYAVNSQRAASFEVKRTLAKLGKPVDRTEWQMTPPTVNAYYEAAMNQIVFPAGILQPPFFDPKADDAVNYGGMGAVIGHEITHGFDDQGRKYDAKGNLSGWWAPEDEQGFTQRANVVVDQFGSYTSVDTLKLNGQLTLGENIADLGGLTIGYGAYRRSLQGKPEPAPIDGLTGDQRFFLAWAQIWRETVRPEYARLLVTVDSHSPGKFRVNGPLSNMPEFAKAFGCKDGDAMIRTGTQRAQIW